MEAKNIRDLIKEIDDNEQEAVHVPEWDVTVFVRGLTARERDRFEASVVVGSGKDTKVKMENARARLVVMSTYDEDGKKVFSTDDIGWLGEKSARALERIFKVAMRLSGLTEEDMEELEKNSVNGLAMQPAVTVELLSKIKTDFPDVDILGESKKWAARKLSEPLTKTSRSSSQIYNFMANRHEWNQEPRKRKSGGEKRPVLPKIYQHES